MNRRFGTPINLPPTKEKPAADFGINWEVSEETIKEIEDLEEQQRVALAHFWHWYV